MAQNFSENFDDVTDWAVQIGSFTAGGTYTSSADPAASIYNTQCDGVTQYVKMSAANFGNLGAVFRATGTASQGFYVVEVISDVIYWVRFTTAFDAEIGASHPAFVLGNTDAAGMTIAGTGASTVVRAWINPTANAPTAADLWDSRAPDATITYNSGTTCDTGRYVGVGFEANGTSVDNWYGGDVPSGAATVPSRLVNATPLKSLVNGGLLRASLSDVLRYGRPGLVPA